MPTTDAPTNGRQPSQATRDRAQQIRDAGMGRCGIEMFEDDSFYVDFQVEHPGYPSRMFWLIWQVHGDGMVTVTTMVNFAKPPRQFDWYWDSEHRMTFGSLLAYIHKLPIPFTTYCIEESE